MFVFTIITTFLVCLAYSESSKITKDSCSNGIQLQDYCHCNLINDFSSSEDLYPRLAAQLICNGAGAVKAMTKILQSADVSLHFSDIQISSSKTEALLYDNLKGFSAVTKLSLMRNDIMVIDSFLLSDFKSLEKLDFSENQIISVNKDAFRFLINLKNLSLSNNKISLIDSAFLPLVKLQQLDLSQNSLFVIEAKWFTSFEKLINLNLADNELYTIKTDAFQSLTSLQQLDLSRNKLTELSPGTFFPLKNLRKLSLLSNMLKTIVENTFKGNKLLDQINLVGNPWICNKQMLPLYDWLKANEVDKSYCSEPPDFVNTTLQNGLYSLYLGTNIEESPICNESMCNCSVSKDKLVITVDCTGRELTKLPDNLPYKTRVLDLRSNYIRSLMMDHVNATLWSDVMFLHLNNNLIDSLKGLEGTWLLRNLVALHLTNNRLTEIPIHILEQFRGGLLDELYLSGNPWNCDCNAVRFQTWLQDNYKIIRDFDRIRCSSDSGIYSNLLISRMLKSQLCPQDVEIINYLDVLNGLMAVAILLIIMKLSFDFWLQKRTGKLPRFFSLNMS